MTLHSLSCTSSSFEKGSTLKGKNLLPRRANSFLLELTPLQKGAKTNDDGAASPDGIAIQENRALL